MCPPGECTSLCALELPALPHMHSLSCASGAVDEAAETLGREADQCFGVGDQYILIIHSRQTCDHHTNRHKLEKLTSGKKSHSGLSRDEVMVLPWGLIQTHPGARYCSALTSWEMCRRSTQSTRMHRDVGESMVVSY